MALDKQELSKRCGGREAMMDIEPRIYFRIPFTVYWIGAEEAELMKYLEESGYIDLCIDEYGYFDLEFHYLSIWRKP